MNAYRLVRVADDLYAELAQYCSKMGVTATRTTQEALRDFLDVVAPARLDAMRVSQREILKTRTKRAR